MTSAKIRTTTLQQMRERNEPIVVVTAYDCTSAELVELAGVDAVLVGDSVGTVVQGRESTVGVTLDEMVYHTRLVARGLRRCLLISDMPFLTAHFSPDETLRAAGRLVQEGGAEAVKVEGGVRVASAVERLVRAGIPVMGHVGLEPQRYHLLGGHKLQGKSQEAAQQIVADAVAVAEAGAFALVIESVPAEVARAVTKAVRISTIGIGGGPDCSGQVLVLHDLIGLQRPGAAVPKFAKQYANVGSMITQAVGEFCQEVRGRTFPVATAPQRGDG